MSLYLLFIPADIIIAKYMKTNTITITPQIKSDALLFLVALIWGSAFVAQRVAANEINPFLFNGLRFTLGGLILTPFVIRKSPLTRSGIGYILLAGCIIYGAAFFQQAGMQTTTAGKAGFLTGLYVVLIPIFLRVFWKRSISAISWIAACTAALGAYLLSGAAELSFVTGDILEMLGSILWAFHVIVISFAVKTMDSFQFSMGQFLVTGILNLVTAVFTGYQLTFSPISIAMIVFTGLFSVGLGYTLQVVGQRHSPPTDASLILSMEAVFAAISGWIFLQESLSLLQILGAILIFGGMLLSQSQAFRSNHASSSVEDEVPG